MSLISVEFLIFTAALSAVYFLVPGKCQWVVMLAANIIFYLLAGKVFPIFLLVTCISAFCCAIMVDRVRERFKKSRSGCHTREEKQKNKEKCTKIQKCIMAVCFIFNFGIWLTLKGSHSPALPLGISFYTFTAMGYCIDVYRGKYQAEKNPARFALFLSFFPHMLQGPFSRYNSLTETLYEVHTFSRSRLKEGGIRILWGVFKKTVIAYRFGMIADRIYGQETAYEGLYIILLMIAVTLQLYADFSGYMDIAAGICRIFGIRLEENFRQPFFARSIEEFWRRWHITLGAWFRDYLFYPVSMGKGAQALGRKCRKRLGNAFARIVPSLIALFVVWTATGFWHGNAWNFRIWGWMNFFFIGSGILLEPVYAKGKELLHINSESWWWKAFQMCRTFWLFAYMEMFSSACSASAAIRLTVSMFRWGTPGGYALLETFGMECYDVAILLFGVLLMGIIDVMKEKKMRIRDITDRMPLVIRYAGVVGMAYMILLLGDIGTDATKGFMYAQF